MKQHEHAVTDLLTVSEVAQTLRISVKGVYRLVERRDVPVIRVARQLRFRRSDLEDYLNQNRMPAAHEQRI